MWTTATTIWSLSPLLRLLLQQIPLISTNRPQSVGSFKYKGGEPETCARIHLSNYIRVYNSRAPQEVNLTALRQDWWEERTPASSSSRSKGGDKDIKVLRPTADRKPKWVRVTSQEIKRAQRGKYWPLDVVHFSGQCPWSHDPVPSASAARGLGKVGGPGTMTGCWWLNVSADSEVQHFLFSIKIFCLCVSMDRRYIYIHVCLLSVSIPSF